MGQDIHKRRIFTSSAIYDYNQKGMVLTKMDLTIQEIAEACGGILVLQGEQAESDTYVSSVSIHSGKVEAGGVFIATEGEKVDGHRFIEQSFTRGGILAVTQKCPRQVLTQYGSSNWGSYVLVENTLQALKDIAEAYRKKLSTKIIGITGSSGKTTTKEFIAAVLGKRYCVYKTEGNFNNEIGVPLTLLGIRPEHEVAVVEMGISDFGEMHRLSKMARPDVCVITNIGQSHLKDLKTRDGILKAKSEIFDYMAKDGEICLNGEDDKLIALKEIKGHKPHFFGLGDNPAQEVVAEEIVCHGLKGSDAVLRIGQMGKSMPDGFQGEKNVIRVPIHISLPGRHMVLNATAAACVGAILGLTGDEIAAGVEEAAAVSGRTNMIQLPQYTLIDDCYNANPESMRVAIDLLAQADTKKIAILGDMFNLGEGSHALHAQMGTHAAKAGIDCIICVGEEAKHLYQAAQNSIENAGQKAVYFPDRHAVLKAFSQDLEAFIPRGSAVLIKASHDMEFKEILDFLQKSI